MAVRLADHAMTSQPTLRDDAQRCLMTHRPAQQIRSDHQPLSAPVRRLAGAHAALQSDTTPSQSQAAAAHTDDADSEASGSTTCVFALPLYLGLGSQ